MSPDVSRRRAPLSRARVLASAVALADAEGVPALTMRGLAAELGVEAMSLYHYVRTKEDLLDGVVEAVVAEVEARVAGLPGSVSDEGSAVVEEWRARLTKRCLAARDVMELHPWAPDLIGSRRTVPPSVFGVFEDVLATMVEGGLSYALAHRGLHALGSMPLGFARELFSPSDAGGSTDTEQAEADLAAMAEAMPHLTAMVAAEVHAAGDDPLGWCDTRSEFEFTLGLLLDGLERARLAVS